MRRTLVIAALAVAPLAGCSTGGATTPAEQVHAAVEAFVADCARDDLAAAQDILTEPAQESFVRAGTEGCSGILGVAPEGARVGAVTNMHGEQYAGVEIGGGRTLDVERRGELWHIATLTAAASPPRRR
jgi:hypothetical protein